MLLGWLCYAGMGGIRWPGVTACMGWLGDMSYIVFTVCCLLLLCGGVVCCCGGNGHRWLWVMGCRGCA